MLDAIERLAAKSLLLVEYDEGAQTRYRMLETIRQYATEKLLDAQHADTARRRHFNYFVALAERAEPELRKANVLEWLDRLEAEHDNLRAALDWSLAQPGQNSEMDLPLDLNKDGTIDTPFGEVKKKGD